MTSGLLTARWRCRRDICVAERVDLVYLMKWSLVIHVGCEWYVLELEHNSSSDEAALHCLGMGE